MELDKTGRQKIKAAFSATGEACILVFWSTPDHRERSEVGLNFCVCCKTKKKKKEKKKKKRGLEEASRNYQLSLSLCWQSARVTGKETRTFIWTFAFFTLQTRIFFSLRNFRLVLLVTLKLWLAHNTDSDTPSMAPWNLCLVHNTDSETPTRPGTFTLSLSLSRNLRFAHNTHGNSTHPGSFAFLGRLLGIFGLFTVQTVKHLCVLEPLLCLGRLLGTGGLFIVQTVKLLCVLEPLPCLGRLPGTFGLFTV